MKRANRWRWHVLGAVAGLAVVFAHAGTALAHEEGDSGFLRDYSRLQESKGDKGGTVRAWTSPKLAPDNYNAVLFDPPAFYPEPRPTEQVSAETLQQILAYAKDAIRRELTAKGVKIVDQAGPGVVRIQWALTGVAAEDEGLAPYQFVPIAFVATMASRAATGTPQRALIIGEAEITDSVTGQLLALRVRVGTGERLAKAIESSKGVVTLDSLKPLLDEIMQTGAARLEEYLIAK